MKSNECHHLELSIAIEDLDMWLCRIEAPSEMSKQTLQVLQRMLLEAGTEVVNAKNVIEGELEDMPLAVLIEELAARLARMDKACA